MRIVDFTPLHALGRDIASTAGDPLAALEARAFEGGQQKMRPLISVRGEDVFVVSTLHAADGISMNDRLVRMLFFIATCRDHGAARVTAVVPWLPYARKDRGTSAREAPSVHLMAAYALCNAQVLQGLLDQAIASRTVTDTAGTITLPAQDPRLRQPSVAPIIGGCLVRMHGGRAISPVLDPTGMCR